MSHSEYNCRYILRILQSNCKCCGFTARLEAKHEVSAAAYELKDTTSYTLSKQTVQTLKQ